MSNTNRLVAFTMALVTTLVASVGRPEPYTVQDGDTLRTIALRHKMSYTALAYFNGIKDVDRIYVGQRFIIPEHPVAEPPKAEFHAYLSRWDKRKQLNLESPVDLLTFTAAATRGQVKVAQDVNGAFTVAIGSNVYSATLQGVGMVIDQTAKGGEVVALPIIPMAMQTQIQMLHR